MHGIGRGMRWNSCWKNLPDRRRRRSAPWLRNRRKNPARSGGSAILGAGGDCDDADGFAQVGRSFRWGWCCAAGAACRFGCGAGGLKFFLNRTRLHLPSSLRHGLANLYRPGNPSAALLAALGMGVMQIMTVYLVQQAVVSELHISSAPNLPNVFLIDIANSRSTGCAGC